jgi:uncharacterized protein (DUF1778 family)
LASIHVEEQAMKEKRTEDALSRPTGEVTQSQSTVYASHHHGSQRDDITMTSAASPAADAVDVQRAILQLQEQFEQLRRRLDDPKREAEEKEGLKKHAEQLEYNGRESLKSQRPQKHAGTQHAFTIHCTQAVTKTPTILYSH